jgi:capsular polysaccharide biosynthesis protein
MIEWMRTHHGMDCTVVTGAFDDEAVFTRHGFPAFNLQDLFLATESRPHIQGMADAAAASVKTDRLRGSEGLPRHFGPQGEGDDAYYLWTARRLTAIYDFLLETVRPRLVFTWNGSLLMSRTLAEAARRAGIPTFFMERGLLPDTLVLDPQGVNYDSHIAGAGWDSVVAPTPTPAEIQRVREYCTALTRTGRTIVASGRDVSSEKLRSVLSIPTGNRIVLLPLQIESDTNILRHSPLYGTMPDIIRDVGAAAAGCDGVTLIVKPHPEDRNRMVELRSLCTTQMRIAEGLSLRSLLDIADVVTTVNSTVGLEALTTRKPVVVLGNAIYGEKGFTWDVKVRRDLQERVEAAMHAAESGEFNEPEFVRFLVYLLKNCLFSLTDADPWHSREGIARRLLKAAAGVEVRQPALSAAALRADVAAQAKPARRRWARKLWREAWRCACTVHPYECLRNLRRALLLALRDGESHRKASE